MKTVYFLLRFIFFVGKSLLNIFIGAWNMLAALINLVDGGRDDIPDTGSRPFTRYNYHSGEVDRVRYPEGIYSDDRIDRSISNS